MTDASRDIDVFIEEATRWKEEMRELRSLLLSCDLTEELKWGKPCYSAHGGNIAIMQPFREHLSLMFFKGALLEDSQDILRSQGENTRAARRLEFTSPEQVRSRGSAVKSYIAEAIQVEKEGLEVPKKKVSEYDVPPEFEARLREDEEYREAFEALTPGRKKGYLLHFSGAKRAETRERRIEKCRAKVLDGKGLRER